MSDTKALAPRTFSLMPSSLGEAKEIASLIANSDFAPKDYKGKPDNVIVALQMGADLGLKPMQALQNIAVINGRPSIYGDAALALSMEVLEKFVETFEGTFPEDTFMAVCVSKRKGWPDETRREFSIADAKKANLWGKAGPWTNYPKRMLQFRARGFNLRDVASDRLLGLILAEEAQDMGPSIEGTVVSSVEVDPMERIPEGMRPNVETAFETLSLAPGLRIAKINEFLGAEGVTADDGAKALLEWCKDEYAKRKTGKPRAARAEKPDNGKKPEPKAADPKPEVKAAEVVEQPKPAEPVKTPEPTPVAAAVEQNSDLF